LLVAARVAMCFRQLPSCRNWKRAGKKLSRFGLAAKAGLRASVRQNWGSRSTQSQPGSYAGTSI